MSAERCPTCGSPVEVVSSDEGTSYYRPEQGDETLEIARTLVAEGRGYGTWENRLAEALVACSAVLEEAERERNEWASKCQQLVEAVEEAAPRLARAEKAERALSELREWFANEPWKGDPDSGDFGGHPYTPNERAIGYGTYRDPRFLPAALRPSEEASDEC